MARRPRKPAPTPPRAPGRCVLLKAGERFLQPDIWIVDADGSPRVWKTWWRKCALERALIANRLARREARVIARLQDLPGFPAFLSHPDPSTIEMSLLDAEPVPEEKGEQALNGAYFARLEELLAEMHRRGINHGDLRRRNLLRAPGDPSTPRLVDFTQCLNFPPPVRGLRAVIFRQAIRVDRVTLLKLKCWYLGGRALTAEEHAELGDQPWHLTMGRFLRKKIYRPFKHWRQGRAGTRRRRKHAKLEQ